MLYNINKLNVYHIQGVALIAYFKLLSFLILSTNNLLHLSHFKNYLKLSDNSFLEVLMQEVELNTIRQLIPDSY